MLVLKNAKIITMDENISNQIYENGMVIAHKGRIVEVGENLEIPENAEIIDLEGKYLVPGFIDAHTHLGISKDLEILEEELEYSDNYIMPQLRVIDAINAQNTSFDQALSSGVTSVVISPGNAFVIGGQAAVLKTSGIVVDNMIVREPAALKGVIGDICCNTKMKDKIAPQSRMMIMAKLREAFVNAGNYDLDEDGGLDLSLDAVHRAKRGRIPVLIYARQAHDIMSAIRLAKEFNLNLAIIGGDDALLVARALKNAEIPVILTPGTVSRTNENGESYYDWSMVKELNHLGVKTALCSSHPTYQISNLRKMAIYCKESGLSDTEALAQITSNPALFLELDDEVGSIAEDKDADFLVFDKHPLERDAKLERVFIRGKECEF